MFCVGSEDAHYVKIILICVYLHLMNLNNVGTLRWIQKTVYTLFITTKENSPRVASTGWRIIGGILTGLPECGLLLASVLVADDGWLEGKWKTLVQAAMVVMWLAGTLAVWAMIVVIGRASGSTSTISEGHPWATVHELTGETTLRWLWLSAYSAISCRPLLATAGQIRTVGIWIPLIVETLWWKATV